MPGSEDVEGGQEDRERRKILGWVGGGDLRSVLSSSSSSSLAPISLRNPMLTRCGLRRLCVVVPGTERGTGRKQVGRSCVASDSETRLSTVSSPSPLPSSFYRARRHSRRKPQASLSFYRAGSDAMRCALCVVFSFLASSTKVEIRKVIKINETFESSLSKINHHPTAPLLLLLRSEAPDHILSLRRRRSHPGSNEVPVRFESSKVSARFSRKGDGDEGRLTLY